MLRYLGWLRANWPLHRSYTCYTNVWISLPVRVPVLGRISGGAVERLGGFHRLPIVSKDGNRRGLVWHGLINAVCNYKSALEHHAATAMITVRCCGVV